MYVWYVYIKRSINQSINRPSHLSARDERQCYVYQLQIDNNATIKHVHV